MVRVPRRDVATAVAVAATVSGLLLSPVDDAGAGAVEVSASASPLAADVTHRRGHGRGSVRLALRVATELSASIDDGAVRQVRATGALVSGRRVVKRFSVRPGRREIVTVRGLEPGRYRVRMDQLTGRLATPGGQVVPVDLTPGDDLRSRSVRVRAGRTAAWRGEYLPTGDLSIAMSGTVVDETGVPIAGLAACSRTITRFAPSRRCSVTGDDGRYTVRLRPTEDVDVRWELLEFGDPLHDLPWQTTVLGLSDVTGRTVTVQRRGEVTGTVTHTTGTPVSGLQVCAVPEEDTGSGSHRWRDDRAWCARTDDAGHYTLRVNGGERLRWPQLPTTQQYLDVMDPYLISGAESLLIDQDGGRKLWDIGMPVDASGGPVSLGHLIAAPGQQLDVTLTSLVPGAAVQVSGVATRPGPSGPVPAATRVCGFTRAGFVCTTTGADGRYALSLPTRVAPESPDTAVRVRVVAPLGTRGVQPGVARFAAVPGSQYIVNLTPGLAP